MELERRSEAEPGPRDFGRLSAGTSPREIDREIAQLNVDVYRTPPDPAAPWRIVPDGALRAAGIPPELLTDRASGFHARLYRDEQGRHVLVFRGTDEARDWMSNTKQGIGLREDQYERAIEVAREASLALGGSLVISGHSVGGGLAAVA